MKNRGGQHGIRLSRDQTVVQVLQRSHTARCNHRNGHTIRHCRCQVEVIPPLLAIFVHARQENLTRARLLHPMSPFHGVDAGRLSTAVRKDFPLVGYRRSLGVDGHDNALRPNRSAASFTNCGRSTAAVLMLTLSAPALSRLRISSSVRMPPPTVTGMKTLAAVRSTTSMIVFRFSCEAVMSRKQSSSAPSRS